jgi:rsbT co-antagonist protein RsbR
MTESTIFTKYSSESFIVFQLDGVIVDANQASLGLTGRSLESLRGQRFQDLISDSDRADVEMLVSGIAKSSEPMEHQARIVDKEGGNRPMQWTFVLHEATSHICVIGRDLTHELAAKREAALTTVLLHAQNVAWAIERDGTFFVHTGGATKNLGMEPGQLLGLNYFQLYAEVPPVRDAAMKALTGEVVVDNDSLVFDRFFNAITVPVRAANGEIVGVAGLTTDITALKRTQKELEEKLALIEDQQRTIQDLSTPIIEVWKGVVAVPVLGTLSGERANKLMERLLEYIVTKQIRYAVLDMTGATAVDEGTADALGRIVQAISLLGAEALLVGLSPSVAQTIVALGISLSAVKTLRNLEEGLRYCMQRK